ncbi:MAG: hypothetical protein MN733_40585 [Nitrososphaera sp.]|nr:hypothetical protein [Nitrososphaera sp.]
MASQENLEQRYQEAKAQLMRIPGVLWVGYGTKERNGKLTNESALRVYVGEKKAPAELTKEQMIPVEVNGLLTDVLKIETSVPLASCQDLSLNESVIGGISISNLRSMKAALASGGSSSSSSDRFGTVGCVVVISNETSKDHFALLTNRHVLIDNGGSLKDPVYQLQLSIGGDGKPKPVKKPSTPGSTSNIEKFEDFNIKEVATIINLGTESNQPFNYPGETPPAGQPTPLFFLDCAIAKIKTDFSSWCDTNKGTDVENKIKGLNIGGINSLQRMGRIKIGDNGKKVFKVGRTTARTVGEIVDPLGVLGTPGNITHENIIIIKATEPNCDNELRFSEEGDSGSVIVTEQREVVGLLFGDNSIDGNGNPRPIADLKAHASHIGPVCAFLGITPLTTEQNSVASLNPSAPPSFAVNFEQPLAGPLRERLSVTARGTQFFELLDKHRPELVHLINHVRPVLVTWHRSKGAEYLSHFINSYRDPDYLIPPQIEDISMKMSLARMVEALRAHGSPDLIKTINRYHDEVFRLAENVQKTEDLFTYLTGTADA